MESLYLSITITVKDAFIYPRFGTTGVFTSDKAISLSTFDSKDS